MQAPLLSLRIFRLLETQDIQAIRNIGSFEPRKAMQMSWVECTMCSWVLQYIGLKNMQVSLLPFKVSSTLIFLNQACLWASTLNFSIRCKSSSGDGFTSSILMHNQQEIEIKKETKSPRTTNGATLRSQNICRNEFLLCSTLIYLFSPYQRRLKDLNHSPGLQKHR